MILPRVGLLGVTFRRVFGWDDWLFDTLFTELMITAIYSATADLHTLKFTVPHTTVLNLHWSYPGNGFIIVSLSHQIIHEIFCAQSNSFLATSTQSPSNAISRTPPKSRQLLTQATFFVPSKPLGVDHAENRDSLFSRRLLYWSVA
jgi:hypothetical protein